MQPGGYGPRPGAYYVHSAASAPPHRQPPPPPQEEMTPLRREEVLMEAGRLAAEHLVAIGELPQHVLQRQHRLPPAPLTFQQGPPALPRPRPFHFQERPLARQHFRFPPPASRDLGRTFARRPFQGRAIAKRPRPVQWRPPALHPGRFTTQVALDGAPAGDGSTSQPVSQSGEPMPVSQPMGAPDTDQSSQSQMNQC
ncbi:Shortage in chiasmata [Hordeum vulgare]|nr:Shortage in chiasmata [Hordeum vulgare]